MQASKQQLQQQQQQQQRLLSNQRQQHNQQQRYQKQQQQHQMNPLRTIFSASLSPLMSSTLDLTLSAPQLVEALLWARSSAPESSPRLFQASLPTHRTTDSACKSLQRNTDFCLL